MVRSYFRRLYRLLLPLLYSRSRFRLFLNTTLDNINLRNLDLASTADYFTASVRPIVIKAPFGKSTLVVAPHQDDEAIGCGGALILQLRSGNAAAIAILQDGADGHEDLGIPRQKLTDLRNEESRNAAARIGAEPPLFFNYARLGESVRDASDRICKVLSERKVDAVFVPFLLDAHPDHRFANYIVAEALRRIPWDVRVFGYEVWGLCIPNVLVVIDDAIEEKKQMLACFPWANSAVDYVHSTVGLNMFHSRMLGAGECRYAERFFEIPRQEYIELVDRVKVAGSLADVPSGNPSGSEERRLPRSA